PSVPARIDVEILIHGVWIWINDPKEFYPVTRPIEIRIESNPTREEKFVGDTVFTNGYLPRVVSNPGRRASCESSIGVGIIFEPISAHVRSICSTVNNERKPSIKWNHCCLRFIVLDVR